MCGEARGLHRKLTTYLFLCTFCRIKEIINCPYFLNSPVCPSVSDTIYVSPSNCLMSEYFIWFLIHFIREEFEKLFEKCKFRVTDSMDQSPS